MRAKEAGEAARIVLANGAEVEVMAYDAALIDGLDGELADGATFTQWDGCEVQRRGDQAVWFTPPQSAARTR